jgi:hypothetical protein
MKEKFTKALNKISNELLTMDIVAFNNIIETHKTGEYAQTLKCRYIENDIPFDELRPSSVGKLLSKENIPEFMKSLEKIASKIL